MGNENNRKRSIEHVLINSTEFEIFDPRNTISREHLPTTFSFPNLTPIINNIYWHSANRQANESEGTQGFPPAAPPLLDKSRPLRRTREVGVNIYRSRVGPTYAAPIVTGTNTDLERLDQQLFSLAESNNFPAIQVHSHPEDYLGFQSLGDFSVQLLQYSYQDAGNLPLLNASCVIGADAQVLSVMTKESYDLITLGDELVDFQQPWRDRFNMAIDDLAETDQIRVELAKYVGAWMYFSTNKRDFISMPPGQIVRRLRSLELDRLRRGTKTNFAMV